MTRLQDLQNQIDELRSRLDLLSGRPRGPITYQEAERDLRAGNKRTMERFVMQLGEGGDRQTKGRNDGKLTDLSAAGSVQRREG